MPNLTRIVSLLLIPCLLADPAIAPARHEWDLISKTSVAQVPLTIQALTLPLTTAHRAWSAVGIGMLYLSAAQKLGWSQVRHSPASQKDFDSWLTTIVGLAGEHYLMAGSIFIVVAIFLSGAYLIVQMFRNPQENPWDGLTWTIPDKKSKIEALSSDEISAIMVQTPSGLVTYALPSRTKEDLSSVLAKVEQLLLKSYSEKQRFELGWFTQSRNSYVLGILPAGTSQAARAPLAAQADRLAHAVYVTIEVDGNEFSLFYDAARPVTARQVKDAAVVKFCRDHEPFHEKLVGRLAAWALFVNGAEVPWDSKLEPGQAVTIRERAQSGGVNKSTENPGEVQHVIRSESAATLAGLLDLGPKARRHNRGIPPVAPATQGGDSKEIEETLFANALQRIPESTPMGKALTQFTERLAQNDSWLAFEQLYGRKYPYLKALFDDPRLILPIYIERRGSLKELEERGMELLKDPEALELFELEKHQTGVYRGYFARAAMVSPDALAVLKTVTKKPAGHDLLSDKTADLPVGMFLASRKSREATLAFLTALDPAEMAQFSIRPNDNTVFWYYLPFLYRELRRTGCSFQDAGLRLAQWLAQYAEFNSRAEFNTHSSKANWQSWQDEDLVELGRHDYKMVMAHLAAVLVSVPVGSQNIPPAAPINLHLEQQIQHLGDTVAFQTRRDLVALGRLDSDLTDARVSPERRLAIYKALLDTRKSVRPQFLHCIEFSIASIERSIASCYQVMKDVERALAHTDLGLESLQVQRRHLGTIKMENDLGSNQWPVWNRFGTALHRMKGELLHSRWLQEGRESDLREALAEMKLSHEQMSKAAAQNINDEERISVAALRARYLAELCIYEPNEKHDNYLEEADRLLLQAQAAIPMNDSIRADLPVYLVALSHGFVFKARNKLEEADKAFRETWDAKHLDVAAIHLMSIAMEFGHLDEARVWGERVKEKSDPRYCYLRGELEASAGEETEGAARREHFLKAVQYWESIPTRHRNDLLRSFGYESQFHFRLLDTSARAGNIPKVIEHLDQVLAHYREGIKPLARTLVEFFTTRDHYVQFVDHVSKMSDTLNANELVSEVQKALTKRQPNAGSLEDEAIKIVSQYDQQAEQARIDELTRQWQRLLELKGFDQSTLDRFLLELQKQVPDDLRARLLVKWSDDFVAEKPDGKRARLSANSAVVLRFVRELRRTAHESDISAASRASIGQLALNWINLRRPWLTSLMDKAKNTQLIDNLNILKKILSASSAETDTIPVGPSSEKGPERLTLAAQIVSARAVPPRPQEFLRDPMNKAYPELLPSRVFVLLPWALERSRLRTLNPASARGSAYWQAMRKKLSAMSERAVEISPEINLLLWVLSLPVPEMASFSLALDDQDTRTYEMLKNFIPPERVAAIGEARLQFLLSPNDRVPMTGIVAPVQAEESTNEPPRSQNILAFESLCAALSTTFTLGIFRIYLADKNPRSVEGFDITLLLLSAFLWPRTLCALIAEFALHRRWLTRDDGGLFSLDELGLHRNLTGSEPVDGARRFIGSIVATVAITLSLPHEAIHGVTMRLPRPLRALLHNELFTYVAEAGLVLGLAAHGELQTALHVWGVATLILLGSDFWSYLQPFRGHGRRDQMVKPRAWPASAANTRRSEIDLDQELPLSRYLNRVPDKMNPLHRRRAAPKHDPKPPPPDGSPAALLKIIRTEIPYGESFTIDELQPLTSGGRTSPRMRNGKRPLAISTITSDVGVLLGWGLLRPDGQGYRLVFNPTDPNAPWEEIHAIVDPLGAKPDAEQKSEAKDKIQPFLPGARLESESRFIVRSPLADKMAILVRSIEAALKPLLLIVPWDPNLLKSELSELRYYVAHVGYFTEERVQIWAQRLKGYWDRLDGLLFPIPRLTLDESIARTPAEFLEILSNNLKTYHLSLSGALRSAFKQVNRSAFVPAYLQQTALRDESVLLQHGQSSTRPSLIAWMILKAFQNDQLKCQNPLKILTVGTGTGYGDAVLANYLKIVRPNSKDRIETIEIVPELAAEAQRLLKPLKETVRVHLGKAEKLGLSGEGPYDAILCYAETGRPEDRAALAKQLKIGGHLIIPWNELWIPSLVVYERVADEEWPYVIEERARVPNIRFVPLISSLGNKAKTNTNGRKNPRLSRSTAIAA